MFNSKYPIVAVGMNQVSDVNLALAVASAGAIPTISAFNYETNLFNIQSLENDFKIYQHQRDSCDFIFSIDDQLLNENPIILDIIKNYNIQYIELITTPNYVKNNFFSIHKIITYLKKLGIKLIAKTIILPSNTNSQWAEYINSTFDSILIKGSLGAGRVLENSDLNLTDLTKVCLKRFPNKTIIPCGGVGTAEEVKELMNLGASAVGIGTLFAASLESSLSKKAKEQLIKNNFNNIKKLETVDLKQNALIFSEVEQSKINNTKGLKKGIKTGRDGHIFAGAGINHITKIRPVKEIIEELCSLL